MRAFDSFVQIGVGENNVGAFAAEFERDALEIRVRSGTHDQVADFGGAGEGNFVHVHVARKRSACSGPVAGKKIDDAFGKASLKNEFANAKRGERSLLRRLQHDGPLSKAARAAETALSTSAASASATRVMTSPVAGLMVGKVLPEAESTHLLLISSLVAETFTVGSMTVVAVAMVHSSLEKHFRGSVLPWSGGSKKARSDYCKEQKLVVEGDVSILRKSGKCRTYFFKSEKNKPRVKVRTENKKVSGKRRRERATSAGFHEPDAQRGSGAGRYFSVHAACHGCGARITSPCALVALSSANGLGHSYFVDAAAGQVYAAVGGSCHIPHGSASR